MLDYCSDQNLKIESNNGCSIDFMYKLYKNLIKKESEKRDDRITGNEKICSTAEFDLLIKDVKKSTILNIEKKFEGNIIGKNNLNKIDEKKEYQIIGEVAKDILHQSPDKIKQISKYIDIILINEILNKTKIKNIENIQKSYEKINLNFNSDKILTIISDGSFIKLLKAYNMEDDDEKIDLDPFLSNREKKNCKCFKKIVRLLNNSGIPYIIFFVPSDLKTQLDDFLIEHIKSKKKETDVIQIYNDNKEKKTQKNIYMSYYIELICRKINYFKNDIIKYILRISKFEFCSICESIYSEIIEKIQPKNEFIFDLIIFGVDENHEYILLLKLFLEEYNFLKINELIIKSNNELNKYINENKKINENVFRIIIFNSIDGFEIKFTIENGKYFSSMLDIKDYDKDYEDFKNEYKKKIHVNKNFMYYSTDKEYLNKKNLLQKIMYDLKKLNYSITYKKKEIIEFKNEYFNKYMQFLESKNVIQEVRSLYEKNIDKEIQKVLILEKKYFININNNKNEVLEEYLCWEIYRQFFNEYLVKKICHE